MKESKQEGQQGWESHQFRKQVICYQGKKREKGGGWTKKGSARLLESQKKKKKSPEDSCVSQKWPALASPLYSVIDRSSLWRTWPWNKYDGFQSTGARPFIYSHSQ